MIFVDDQFVKAQITGEGYRCRPVRNSYKRSAADMLTPHGIIWAQSTAPGKLGSNSWQYRTKEFNGGPQLCPLYAGERRITLRQRMEKSQVSELLATNYRLHSYKRDCIYKRFAALYIFVIYSAIYYL